jgi:hypothetical protein
MKWAYNRTRGSPEPVSFIWSFMHICLHLSIVINNKKPTYLFRGSYKELFFIPWDNTITQPISKKKT